MTASARVIVVAMSLVLAAVPPSWADQAESFGRTCEFAASSDPTGAMEQNPHVRSGEMHGGPWTAADLLADDGSGASGAVALASITITCVIQVNSAYPGSTPAASVSGSGTGVAVGSGPVAFVADESDNVYVCTYVSMVHDGAYENWTYDEDRDPSNGVQCALAVAVGSVKLPPPVGEAPPTPGPIGPLPIPDGHHAAVGDDIESGSVSHTGIADGGVTEPLRRMHDPHSSVSACAFDRHGLTATVGGRVVLTKHAGHARTEIECLLYDGVTGQLLGRRSAVQAGSSAQVSFSTQTYSRMHRICMTAIGVWNDDGHYVAVYNKCWDRRT